MSPSLFCPLLECRRANSLGSRPLSSGSATWPRSTRPSRSEFRSPRRTRVRKPRCIAVLHLNHNVLRRNVLDDEIVLDISRAGNIFLYFPDDWGDDSLNPEKMKMESTKEAAHSGVIIFSVHVTHELFYRSHRGYRSSQSGVSFLKRRSVLRSIEKILVTFSSK